MELYENCFDNPFICVRLLTTSSGYVTKEINSSYGNHSLQTIAHLIEQLPRQRHHILIVMVSIIVCLVSGTKSEL